MCFVLKKFTSTKLLDAAPMPWGDRCYFNNFEGFFKYRGINIFGVAIKLFNFFTMISPFIKAAGSLGHIHYFTESKVPCFGIALARRC